jgi:D-alanine-D-alanine ligase
MTHRKRIGVIYGGRSSEHDVSIRSARTIIAGLNSAKYEVIPIAISRTGHWLPEISPDALSSMNSEAYSSEKGCLSGFYAWVMSHPLDIVFPTLHGIGGEDGSVQGLMEFLDIPYVGNGVLGSAIGIHKEKTKQLAASVGIPVVPWVTTTRHQLKNNQDAVLTKIKQRLDGPVFIKPVREGSSVGVSRVTDASQLLPALHHAAQYDRDILIEQAISCREIECGVLGNEEPQVSVFGEVHHERVFFDYHAKYADETFRFLIPAHVQDHITSVLRDYAIRAFQVLSLRGLARIDFFLDRQTQQLYLNEVNTFPGFTDSSTYPQLWAASGVPFVELLDRLVELAIEAK